jgi:hypothetical protein
MPTYDHWKTTEPDPFEHDDPPCPGHEATDESTREGRLTGWHPARCKHCGADMSCDSGG